MNKLYKQFLEIVFLIAILIMQPALAFAQLPSSTSPADTKLYVLNCGYLDMPDGAHFSQNGYYAHKPLHFATPCFLIKHENQWLLWDLGLGDQYYQHPYYNSKLNTKLSVPVSLVSQLNQIGLAPSDINYIAFSHVHFDHTGNANLFPNATWILQKKEYQYLQTKPLPAPVILQNLKHLASAHKLLIDGDYDVFGDGSVIILATPGHTPGHQSLEVKLPQQGVVILSGDLYHTRADYQYKLIPIFNTSATETLASMEKLNTIVAQEHAQLVIQHDPTDFAALPKVPQFLH